ncbi:MAG: hypothetical protein ACREQ2_23410 [Candidatus Binatia bacterium]
MNSNLINRLEKRKQDIVMTIAHIRREQTEVEMNTEWKDLFAQQRRHALPADLSNWYDGKLKQIDNVLDRIAQPDRSAWGHGAAGPRNQKKIIAKDAGFGQQ